MNLNGGYIMLDLDDTSNLLVRTQAVFESDKPTIIKKDNVMYYAVKYRDTYNDYCFALSSNKMFSIGRFSGQLAEKIVLDTKKYRHIGTFSFLSSGVTQKVTIELINTHPNAYTTGASIISALKNDGFDSENSMKLCVYSGNYAQVYATVSSSNASTLHYKPSGATEFSTIAGANTTFVSDKVVEI